ncbi:MAG TPA: tyrosine--tRNA ligase [Kofleriaceae bacterium]|nr:tyrosine--tRNA ligase [Kofleriaceae bacterium]
MILDDLEARGLVADSTDPDALRDLLDSGPIAAYCGIDPTSDSLHLGHLVSVSVMARLQRAGHKPIAVVGGATGMIGDPSGKSAERVLLDGDTLARNVAGIRGQLSRFLQFGDGPTDALLVNNADWLSPMSVLAFLRDVGKLITVNYMMAKESVKARIEDREQGLSYTEFSYMLLQAYDFVHLAEAHGCRLQIGGTDQWGNITCGIEVQRKLGRSPLAGLVFPLLLDASGQKMGKTAAGQQIWLDPQRTSPYAFYQYFLNVADADVGRLLRIFSQKSLDEIAAIETAHAGDPGKREGQRALAEEITGWVHGAGATRRAIAASGVMFGGALDDLTDEDLEPLLGDVPSTEVARDSLAGGIRLVDALADVGLAKSKGAARRLVAGGGVYVNNQRVSDPELLLTTESLATATMLILRAGKKSYHILRAG